MIRTVCVAASLLLLVGRDARAHAGVPISTDVLSAKANGQSTVAFETTFGLLSLDAQNQWRLTCEETKEPGQKLFKLWPDGEVGMGYSGGYAYSTDGCDFTSAKGVSASARTLETADPGLGGTPVLVLLTDLLDSQESGTNLFTSSDRGRTFQQVHLPKAFSILSMVVSKTTPPEVVMTADLAEDPEAGGQRTRWLLRSSACVTNATCTDADWTQVQLKDAIVSQGITKVLALLPEGLFLRNVTGQDSRLLRSLDGGTTTTVVLPTASQQLPNPVDFLSRVGDGDLWISAGLQQTFHSVDGGATWERRAEMGDIRCLHEVDGALHSCVVDLEKNTVGSRSDDGGKTWSPELRYDQVVGMKQCSPNSDVGAACDDLWLLVSLSFQGQQGNPPVLTPSPTPKKSGCSSVDASLVGLVVALGMRVSRRHRPVRRM